MTSPPILRVERTGTRLDLTITTPSVMTGEALQLRTEAAAILESSLDSIESVHLDVSAIQLMSSRGFETLVLLHSACRDRNITLTCSKQTEMFRQLMERMGFAKLFEPTPGA
ncbi:MAG: STAS domain-containing protein [Phycisphaerales bacterium]|nr:STAS domain-containing protein [Phycisphaerales bacterium]